MSDAAPVAEPVLIKKKRSRVFEYLIVLVLIGVMAATAFYQEQISAFFRLRLWDQNAPSQTVASFLSAGKKGDQKQADGYLGVTDFKPLMKNGKWSGYFMTTQAGRLDFSFDELAPSGNPKPSGTEFITNGKGASQVTMSDAKGNPVVYRLEMKEGGWRITEIRGGRMGK